MRLPFLICLTVVHVKTAINDSLIDMKIMQWLPCVPYGELIKWSVLTGVRKSKAKQKYDADFLCESFLSNEAEACQGRLPVDSETIDAEVWIDVWAMRGTIMYRPWEIKTLWHELAYAVLYRNLAAPHLNMRMNEFLRVAEEVKLHIPVLLDTWRVGENGQSRVAGPCLALVKWHPNTVRLWIPLCCCSQIPHSLVVFSFPMVG